MNKRVALSPEECDGRISRPADTNWAVLTLSAVLASEPEQRNVLKGRKRCHTSFHDGSRKIRLTRH